MSNEILLSFISDFLHLYILLKDKVLQIIRFNIINSKIHEKGKLNPSPHTQKTIVKLCLFSIDNFQKIHSESLPDLIKRLNISNE